ncbi:hypothetical protein BKA82DRAFT_31827 [Pisolithus tinctorius]|uniref:F-box domain-containing protein n=1 Tax=Pisolithus tinctorius Marx 270 TaxID=870435 RepID=A0A0C3JJY6_PISTI|nr:hypothetical protein BKA82DRAFT_31827 [Pisolithus tinctorius]KIN97881.1 hypothetical protein M404DRAFT_31827 [Pisolithus tinctorius Marx 270]
MLWNSTPKFAVMSRSALGQMATRTKRAATQLPDLPPELWNHIFDFATYVPYTLVPEIFEKSIFIGPYYNQQYHPKLRAALVTKRYLVREIGSGGEARLPTAAGART